MTTNQQSIITNYNPTTKDKILCIGWDTDRAERLVTETMVELMKEYSLTFDEVDEIVYGTSLEEYLEHNSEFKYKMLDKCLVEVEFTPTDTLNIEIVNLREENEALRNLLEVSKQKNDKLKKELRATQEKLKTLKKLVKDYKITRRN